MLRGNRTMKKFLTAAALAFAFTSGANAAIVFDQVENGSFENNHTAGTSWFVFDTVDPWYTVEGTGIEIQHNSVIGSADAQDGEYYVELDSHAGRGGDTTPGL